MSDAALLAAVVAAYGLADARLVPPAGRVLRVATADGELALKHFPAGEEALAEREAALLAHLAPSAQRPADPRYRVQTLVRTERGALLLHCDGGAILVTRWEAGVRKSYDAIDAAEWRALGLALAALHARLDDFTLPAAPLEPLSAMLARRQPAADRAALESLRAPALARDATRAPAVARYLDDKRALYDGALAGARTPPPTPERAIHNDYNQYNYLFDGRLPPRVLDWEGAIAAPREYEVVRCLNHLPLVATAHARAFVAGYRQARPLERRGLVWAVDAALFDHAGKLWQLERYVRDEPGAAAHLDGTMAMVRTLVAGRGALLDFWGAA